MHKSRPRSSKGGKRIFLDFVLKNFALEKANGILRMRICYALRLIKFRRCFNPFAYTESSTCKAKKVQILSRNGCNSHAREYRQWARSVARIRTCQWMMDDRVYVATSTEKVVQNSQPFPSWLRPDGNSIDFLPLAMFKLSQLNKGSRNLSIRNLKILLTSTRERERESSLKFVSPPFFHKYVNTLRAESCEQLS